MADYYDRLEDQLARATARGVRRRFAIPRPRLPRLRWDWVTAGAGVAVCVVVSVVAILALHSAGQDHGNTSPGGGHPQLPVIHNLAPAKPPRLGGTLVCDATLSPPPGRGSETGKLVVNGGQGNSELYALTARGLKRAPAGERYEVWTIPEVRLTSGAYQLQYGARPRLFGVISPPIAADGLLAAAGKIPPRLTGDYRLEVTVQPQSAKSPGHVVLRGDAAF